MSPTINVTSSNR